jgi:predicted MFS family arabinose efflux permease
VSGPTLAVALATGCSTGLAVGVGAAVLVIGTVGFAVQPASRDWRPEAAAPRDQPPAAAGSTAATRSPGLWTLIIVTGALGLVFSAVQVGVAAATSELGTSGAAGPLLAVWGAGSFLGGLVATRGGGGARSARGLCVLLAALTVGHLTLTLVATSTVGMAVVLLLAGTTIAPTEATLYAKVDDVSVASRLTESFSWLATATAAGEALGAATGGWLAASAGPAAAFGVAGVAGVVALLVSVVRRHTLPAPAPAASVTIAKARAITASSSTVRNGLAT